MSSYIAFDLDALNVCPQVGAACGLTPEQASHGLLQMWAFCFRRGVCVVEDVHLRGFFFGMEAGPALEAFGFLESSQDGWRVKGAERYLRVNEGRSRGGKIAAAKGNLKRGKQAPKRRGELETSSSSSPAPLQLLSSLSPTTEHRLPTTELKEGSTAPPAPPLRDAVDELRATWNLNKHPDMPEWRETGPDRRRTAKARLKERPLHEWLDVVQRIAASGFCRGLNDRGWRADPEWLLRPGTATKVLEGRYDDRAAVPKSRDWRSAVAAELRAEAAAQPQPAPEGAW